MGKFEVSLRTIGYKKWMIQDYRQVYNIYKDLSLSIWCNLYQRFYGMSKHSPTYASVNWVTIGLGNDSLHAYLQAIIKT